jgi:hypothetical protein
LRDMLTSQSIKLSSCKISKIEPKARNLQHRLTGF